jgi:hypothetical protein
MTITLIFPRFGKNQCSLEGLIGSGPFWQGAKMRHVKEKLHRETFTIPKYTPGGPAFSAVKACWPPHRPNGDHGHGSAPGSLRVFLGEVFLVTLVVVRTTG